VFQVEGSGMTRCVMDLRPTTLDHLAALVALYRPGPMAHIPSYIARRDGREVPTPPDPSLQDVLEESYGVIVYQDQVLQVVRKLAGYSLGQADVLRRAMGKKEKAVMAEEGPKFISAAVEHGYSSQTAERVWDLLQPFAGYAFNKAHAYCYALVAFQTAYLKANYPIEWFAAVLSTIAADTEKVVGVVGECRRLNVELLPPDINASRLEFSVEGNGIRYGLGAVKNVGAGAVELLVKERDENGPYTSLEEFCRRQDLHTVNKRVLESLIKCGTFDGLGVREALIDSKRLDAAIAAAQIDQRAASTGQGSLFDIFGGAEGVIAAPPPTVAPVNVAVSARERALWEKEVLGFQFGDHPYMEAAAWLANRLTHDTGRITAELSGERVVMAGLLTGVRRIVTRNKAQMAVLTVEDLHGTIEVVVFPRVYERSLELWREDAILVLEGKVDTRSERPQIVLDRAEEWTAPANGAPPPPLVDVVRPEPVQTAPVDIAPSPGNPNGNGHGNGNGSGSGSGSGNGHHAVKRVLRVDVPRGDDDNACLRVLEQLHGLVESHKGTDELVLVLRDRSGGVIQLEGAEIGVAHSPELEGRVRGLVGTENVRLL
jgi:DNA polymerase-3 subunit alpha